MSALAIRARPSNVRQSKFRAKRRWVPLALSGALHLAALFVAFFFLVVAEPTAPRPKVLSVAAVEMAPLDALEAFELVEDLEIDDEVLPEDAQVDLPEDLSPPDTPSEACDLPECAFDDVHAAPVLTHEVPLHASLERKPRPRPAPVPAATPSRPAARAAAPAPRPRPVRRGRPLKLLGRPNLLPFYPVEARRRGIEGEALVEIRVDEHGRVVDAQIVRSSGSPLLDRAAVRVLYEYRFAAGDGGRSRVPVNFRLR